MAIAIVMPLQLQFAAHEIVLLLRFRIAMNWFRSLGFGPDQLTVFVRGLVCQNTCDQMDLSYRRLIDPSQRQSLLHLCGKDTAVGN